MAKVHKNSLKNLPQYRDMADEDFEQAWEKYNMVVEDSDSDAEIEAIMEKVSQDFELRDMLINDTILLREMAKELVFLDKVGKVERQLLDDGAFAQLRAFSSIKKEHFDNVSRIQEDLNIKRKQRQNDTGDTLDMYLPSILKKAKTFYEQRLAYIYCPKCKMLCGNAWFTDWKVYNQIHMTCPREGCEHKFQVTSEYLSEHGNKNVEGVLPV